ncbi:hypothetical protein [Mesorhizobium sp. Root157]|uniref:hypothetical protein n=1 Tax=Mesorhizobium sp. Root157 TaxID=1736477 RepID=UPI000AFF001C|nr:hypothetical protein [Mesorhizobium sp. Root157]
MKEIEQADSKEKRLLTLAEAARYCGVSPKAFRREFRFAEYSYSTARIRRYDRCLIDEIIDKADRAPFKSDSRSLS